jgi:hypothetical protein
MHDLRCLRKILPAAAQQLAAQLRGEETLPIPAPGIAAEVWLELMRRICAGTNPRTAMGQVGVSRGVVAAYRRADPSLAHHYRACVKAGRRKRWPMLVLEEVFDEIASTNTTAKAALMRRGYTEAEANGFYRVVWGDPDLAEQYQQAKAIQQEALRGELMSETWSRIDEIASSAAAGQHTRTFNKAELAIRKLLPQRQRRAEAKEFRAERVKGDPLAAARLRAATRKPV